jgi:hypothetical protein
VDDRVIDGAKQTFRVRLFSPGKMVNRVSISTDILEGITIADLAAKERRYKHNGGRYYI